MLAKQEKYDKAVEAFEEATKINPEDVRAHCQKGLALKALGGHDQEAEEAFDKVISLKAQLANAYFQKRLALKALGGHDQEALEAGVMFARLSGA